MKLEKKMNNLEFILSAIVMSLSFSLIGCSDNSQTKSNLSIYKTKLEAEKAAKNFNCIGAHRMGDKWMSCESHSAHEKNKKSRNYHHHH